jgi:uncharacterized protein (DUF3084 family)
MTEAATPQAPATENLTLDEAAERFVGLIDPDNGRPDEAPEKKTEAAEPANEQQAEAETEQAEETPPETPQKKTYKLKAAGQELEVDEDELVKGYQRHQDYKAKTTEIAEQRRKLEADAQAVQAERQQYIPQLQSLITNLQDVIGNEFQDIKNPADLLKLQAEDPLRFQRWQALQAVAQHAHAQREHLTAEQRRQQESAHKAYLAEQDSLLVEKEPAFKEAKTRKALASYLKETGFSDDEIGQLADHRTALVAYEAMQYRKMKNAKPEEKVVAKQAPKVVKPGAAQTQTKGEGEFAAAKDRLRKSGKLQDAAAAFIHLMPN